MEEVFRSSYSVILEVKSLIVIIYVFLLSFVFYLYCQCIEMAFHQKSHLFLIWRFRVMFWASFPLQAADLFYSIRYLYRFPSWASTAFYLRNPWCLTLTVSYHASINADLHVSLCTCMGVSVSIYLGVQLQSCQVFYRLDCFKMAA